MSLNNLDHNRNLVSVSAEEEEEEEEEYACYLADDIDAAVFDSFFPSADSSEDPAGTLHPPPPIITESAGSEFANAASLGDDRGGSSRTGSDLVQARWHPSTQGKTVMQATAAFQRPQVPRAEVAEARAAALPQRGRPVKGWAGRIGAEIQFRAPGLGKAVAATDENHSLEWDQASLRSGRLGVRVQKVNKLLVLPSIDHSGSAPSANLAPSVVLPNSGDPPYPVGGSKQLCCVGRRYRHGPDCDGQRR